MDVRQFMLFEAARTREHLAYLLDQVGSGQLTPPEGERFPFENFAEAMNLALSGQSLGKPVIVFSAHGLCSVTR